MSTNHQSASNGAGLRVHIFSNVYIPCTLLLLSTNNRSSTIRRHNQGDDAPLWGVAPSTKEFGPIGCQGFAPPLRALDSPKIAVPVMMPAMVPIMMFVMAFVMNIVPTPLFFQSEGVPFTLTLWTCLFLLPPSSLVGL